MPGNIREGGGKFNYFQDSPDSSADAKLQTAKNLILYPSDFGGAENRLGAASVGLGRKVRTPKSAMPCNQRMSGESRSPGYTRAECFKAF